MKQIMQGGMLRTLEERIGDALAAAYAIDVAPLETKLWLESKSDPTELSEISKPES